MASVRPVAAFLMRRVPFPLINFWCDTERERRLYSFVK